MAICLGIRIQHLMSYNFN